MTINPVSILMLSEQDVRGLDIPLTDIVALTEAAYRADADGVAEVPTKIAVHPDYPESFLHAMPAWVGGSTRALGMKWVSYFPGNFDRGMPDSTGIIILNHPDHGLPVCIMEGMYVTFVRTAACAAVAVKHLRREPPRRLGLIGCGGLGRWSLRTLRAAFPSIKEVRVASRRADTRIRFCEEMGKDDDIDIRPADEVRQAVESMDVIISSMPPSAERPVHGEWLSPGALFIPLDLINSWEDGLLRGIPRIVADNPAHFFKQVKERLAGAYRDSDRADRLQDIVAGRGGAADADSPALVAICGIASTDVVIGWDIYRRATAQGAGQIFKMN